MDDLAQQRCADGIEAQLDGFAGVAQCHGAIGETEALMGGHEEVHRFAVVDGLGGQWEVLGMVAAVGGLHRQAGVCKGLG
jgi:hypothetical protein